MKIWQSLYEVYRAYKNALAQRRLAYDGMAYRYLVGQLESGQLNLPFPKVIFAGFNALSLAEERIMRTLLGREQAVVYWDVDECYFPRDRNEKSRVGEEPGKFIREYHTRWKALDSRLIVTNMLDRPMEIVLTGVPLLVGQAQHLGNLLEAGIIRLAVSGITDTGL